VITTWDHWTAMVNALSGETLQALPGPPGRQHIAPSAGFLDPGLPAFERRQRDAAIRRRMTREIQQTHTEDAGPAVDVSTTAG
jgi:hypothetical protein